MPGLGGCLLPGGVSALGGSAPRGVPTLGVLDPGRGDYLVPRGSAWCQGGCLVPGGMPGGDSLGRLLLQNAFLFQHYFWSSV